MISDSTETLDTLLARYVAGALPAPAQVLVAAHLEIRRENRALVAEMERLAGDALEDEPPLPLADRERRLAAVFGAPGSVRAPRPPRTARIFPDVLRDFAGFEAEETPWRTKLPGFREYDFGDVDGCHVSLFWLRPGRRIPTHTHGGLELSLVLDGAFSDFAGRYARGDISIADESVEHRPTAGRETPCIGFAVSEAPLRLSGPFGQRLIDIIAG